MAKCGCNSASETYTSMTDGFRTGYSRICCTAYTVTKALPVYRNSMAASTCASHCFAARCNAFNWTLSARREPCGMLAVHHTQVEGVYWIQFGPVPTVRKCAQFAHRRIIKMPLVHTLLIVPMQPRHPAKELLGRP